MFEQTFKNIDVILHKELTMKYPDGEELDIGYYSGSNPCYFKFAT